MASLRPPTLLALTSYVAGHVARLGHLDLVAALDSYDLRLPHYATLAALDDFGPLPQHDLAARLGFNRSHLVGYLDTIQQQGLVQRERDTKDRRIQRITLTEKGRALCEELHPVARHSQQRLTHTLNEKERDTLNTLLSRVLEANDAAGIAQGSDKNNTAR